MKDAIIEVGEIDGEFDVSFIRWSYDGGKTWNEASIAELITAFEKEQEKSMNNKVLHKPKNGSDYPVKIMVEDREYIPVVRCKDCKYRYLSGVGKQHYVCDFVDAELKDNGYCSYGERREEQEHDS